MAETKAEHELRDVAAFLRRHFTPDGKDADACDIGREAIALLRERQVSDDPDRPFPTCTCWNCRVHALLTRAGQPETEGR